jgi:glutaredoxin
VAAFSVSLAYGQEPPAPIVDLEVFSREGCPHCEAAKRFLSDLQRERPDLRVQIHDIGADPAGRERLLRLAAERGITNLGVPAFLIRDTLLIGFAGPDTTGAQIKALLSRPPPTSDRAPEDIVVPLLGRLNARDSGLPAFTLAIGLLDGFNPCAMWVLLFLLALLANLRDRRKMVLIAGTFVVVSGAVYFAFMAAWLNVFLFIGLSRTVQVALGALALTVGAINIKDFFAFKQGISLSIPESTKPGLYARVRRILQAQNLPAALGGVIVLAVVVNLIELLCTAGFPALYTQILTLRQLPSWQYYGYLALYNVAYMLDDAIMVAIAVATLGSRKLQDREGRWLKLVSGVVMAGLGAVLLLKPEWLT